MFDDVKSTFEVPRVERPSRREFEERFLFPQRPVIISGAMEGWPARERWTNDYLTEKVGARTVRPQEGPPIPLRPEEGAHRHAADEARRYIDLLAGAAISDGQLYPGAMPIRTTLPELWPDVRFPPFVDEEKYRHVNFWFGPGNNFTPLHFDAANNFLAQIRGRKQMILCPPREIAASTPSPSGTLTTLQLPCHPLLPGQRPLPGSDPVPRLGPRRPRSPRSSALATCSSSPSTGGMPSGALTRTCRSTTGGALAPPTSSSTPARRLTGPKKSF